MDQDNESRLSNKEIPVYSWHTKEEGKAQYAQFAEMFISAIKHLRYLLEPGAVARRLGQHPGPAPAGAAQRRDWRDEMTRYECRLTKIDEHFAAALSALESSFVFSSLPRHLIKKVIETPPAGVQVEDWTYQAKFEACWEALRLEYQPSTAVDLSQLRDKTLALTDEAPGGFDFFKSEFHRLHAEIVATRVPQAITDRELNGIVRDGIKNPMVWGFVCHNIYSNDINAPWEQTFEAVSKFLTSFRQKGIDPYGEAKGGLMSGFIPVAANSASTTASDKRSNTNQKRSAVNDHGGRPQKTQKVTMSTTETVNQGSNKHSSSHTSTSRQDNNRARTDRKCTRCWNPVGHSYKDCSETKCACGKSLANGQVICFNYDNHPPSLQFTDKIPRSLQPIIDAYRKGRSSCTGGSGVGATSSSASTSSTSGGRSNQLRNRNRPNTRAFAANVAEELLRRGVGGNNLDQSA